MNAKAAPDKASRLIKTLLPVVSLLFVFGLAAKTSAQVTFVHLTDPHIFDDYWQEPGNTDPKQVEDNRLDNRAALESCLWNINERTKYGEHFDFGVITGDLGIEYLVKDTRGFDDQVVDKKLEDAATALARLLELSSIRVWLFVPGNNDVLCEKPANIFYYHKFITKLKAAFDVKDSDPAKQRLAQDLCPEAKSNYATQDSFHLKDYVFIGFNDSSFKNSDPDKDDPEELKRCPQTNRIADNAVDQKANIVQVQNLLQNDPARYAYVFYHIPEVDDPYFVTLADNRKPVSTRLANAAAIGKSFYYSAWYVQSGVRDEWNKVVMNPRVRGLFAGHFHDNKKESYLSFQWLKTRTYLPDTLSKLHVAPPLALKVQYDKTERARGFQEVYIDALGSVSTRIVWLNQGRWGLANDLEAKETEALQQLSIGDAYVANGRLSEAESAYLKAAASTWPPVRQRAMEAAAKVISDQESRWQKYAVAPFRTALATGITTLASVILGLLVVLVVGFYIAPFARSYGEWKGRRKLKIISNAQNEDSFASAFAGIITMVFGRMRSHYNRNLVVRGQDRVLPMVVGSQVADIAELIDSTLPEGPAKVIAWVLKKTDSPEYLMVATVQMVPERRWMRPNGGLFVVLHQSGRTLRTWHKTEIDQDLPTEEIQLAFASLRYLVRHMNP